MDDEPRPLLFDPAATRRLVLSRRPARPSAVEAVVSDVVWTDVVRLLRWAAADTNETSRLEVGAWERLAIGCADLLLRLPGLSDEVGRLWPADARADESDLPGPVRIERAAGRLTALLRSADPLPLRLVGAEVDALGAAAVAALAEREAEALLGAR